MKSGFHGLTIALSLAVLIAGVAAAVHRKDDGVTIAAGKSENEPVLPNDASAEKSRFPVTIRKPSGPPRIVTDRKHNHGGLVTVACSTCHSTRTPNSENKTVSSLDEFHRGMTFSHGTVSCLSCHNAANYDLLQLADGSPVEFTDVMMLCGQCHGPQMNDFEHGAHGGVSGFWDLSRGPQAKNNCVDCHNPHSPQFPKMHPTFKPRDRFLEESRSEH